MRELTFMQIESTYVVLYWRVVMRILLKALDRGVPELATGQGTGTASGDRRPVSIH